MSSKIELKASGSAKGKKPIGKLNSRGGSLNGRGTRKADSSVTARKPQSDGTNGKKKHGKVYNTRAEAPIAKELSNVARATQAAKLFCPLMDKCDRTYHGKICQLKHDNVWCPYEQYCQVCKNTKCTFIHEADKEQKNEVPPPQVEVVEKVEFYPDSDDDEGPYHTLEEKADIPEEDKQLLESSVKVRNIVELQYMMEVNPDKAAKKCMERAALVADYTGYKEGRLQWARDYLAIVQEVYTHPFYVVTNKLRLRRWWNQYKYLFITILTVMKVASVAATLGLNFYVECFKFVYEIIKFYIWLQFFHETIWIILFVLVMRYVWFYINENFTYFTECRVNYIDGFCVRQHCPELMDIEPGCGEYTPASNPICVNKQYQVGFAFGKGQAWVPQPCSCNLHVAVVARQLLEPIGEEKQRMEAWETACNLFSKEVEHWPKFHEAVNDIMEERFFAHFTGPRRYVLMNAWANSASTYWNTEANSGIFSKVEVINGKKKNKRHPRCISSKSDDFLVRTGPEYYAWQKLLCKTLWATSGQAVQQKFIYTGGMDGETIGEIVSFFERGGWWAIEGDYSRFDGHTEIEALKAEIDFYARCKGMSEKSAYLFRQRFHSRGRARDGMKFKVRGKRDSGAINTSLGNTINGFQMACYIMQDFNKEIEWVVLQLGDDNIFFVRAKDPDRRCDYALLEQIRATMVVRARELGHDLVCVTRNQFEYDFLEYCSSRFWNIGHKRVLSYKPGRVLCKTFIAAKPQRDMDAYIRGIAVGMRHSSFIPVLGPIIKQLSRGCKPTKRLFKDHMYSIVIKQELEVDQQTINEQFERVYGFHPACLENGIKETDFTRLGVCYDSDLIERLLRTDGAWADPDIDDL